MKATRRTSTVEIIDVDEVALDEIKIFRIAGGLFERDKPGIRIMGRERAGGCATYNSHAADATIEEMPEDLRSALMDWAQGVLNRAVAAEVAKHEAEGVAA